MVSPFLVRRRILTGSNLEYAADHLLDRGTTGRVYCGHTLVDRKKVAIKMLSDGRFPLSDAAILRFRQEVNSYLRIDHPNVVKYYDYGLDHREHVFFVMEYLEGGTIAQRIQRKDYSDSMASRWCSEIVGGLKYLHDHGFVHRDLKPSNLLLTKEESAKIGDLGILYDISPNAYLTMAGDQMGAVPYISRHQRDHPELASPSDDTYSACCCCYEILSRERIHVFPKDLFEVTRGRIPRHICDLIMGCLTETSGDDTLRQLSEFLGN